MPTATALRLKIEHALETRFPAALSPAPRTVRDVAMTGIDAVDRLLDGGIPVGAICELIGPASSGRTSLALAYLARRTEQELVCAWIDACDAFDPESAAAAGVTLHQLLWVRCSDSNQKNRSEMREQKLARNKPWTRLDQALRATDLLLQAAGFAVIILDLGDFLPEHVRRIPLATWFRFRQAAERTRSSLVVLAHTPCAQSSPAVVLHCAPMCAEDAGSAVLERFTFSVRRERQRFAPSTAAARKPPGSTWCATGAWTEDKRA